MTWYVLIHSLIDRDGCGEALKRIPNQCGAGMNTSMGAFRKSS